MASARPSRTAAAATDSSSDSGRGVMRSSPGGCGRRSRPAGARRPSSSRAARDAVVVEVVDEAQPQGRAGGLVEGFDQALEGAVVVRIEGGLCRRVIGHDLALARAVVIHGRRGGDAVEPGAQVVGVTQLRIGPQRAQQRVLQDVLGLVARQPARVDQQLVAVGLYERPERWQHVLGTRAPPQNVSYRFRRTPTRVARRLWPSPRAGGAGRRRPARRARRRPAGSRRTRPCCRSRRTAARSA